MLNLKVTSLGLLVTDFIGTSLFQDIGFLQLWRIPGHVYR